MKAKRRKQCRYCLERIPIVTVDGTRTKKTAHYCCNKHRNLHRRELALLEYQRVLCKWCHKEITPKIGKTGKLYGRKKIPQFCNREHFFLYHKKPLDIRPNRKPYNNSQRFAMHTICDQHPICLSCSVNVLGISKRTLLSLDRRRLIKKSTGFCALCSKDRIAVIPTELGITITKGQLEWLKRNRPKSLQSWKRKFAPTVRKKKDVQS